MHIDLSGQVILITGASRGIGRAIAIEFGHSGATLALTGRDAAAIKETARAARAMSDSRISVSLHIFDLAQEGTSTALVDEVMARWGRIDVLVNNAGVSSSEDVLDEQMLKIWEETRRLNLDAAYVLSRLVGAEMVKQRHGAIINIGSIAGASALRDHEIAYSTTKAGLAGLTRALADTIAPSGVRVNTVAPGYIATEMNEAARRDRSFVDAIVDGTPLGRFGTPEEVAYATVFLASSQAGYITGQTLYVDGGWTIR
jgi:3-oxoacyl-[acyl-carrier protein] reductase